MASVILVDEGPVLFTPDAATANGPYINSANRLVWVFDDASSGNKSVMEVNSVGGPTVSLVAAYGFQIRDLSPVELFEVRG